MPRLDLNFEDLKPWCLYHNVHGCPCEKYKDPLEFGPDVNVSRNFAKRTLGNKFKTRKNITYTQESTILEWKTL